MTYPSPKPGTLIVLEGLDRTGKSTQARALEHALNPAATTHVHMPSGFTTFTGEMYAMLDSEQHRPTSGLARQLAHLACHAESIPRILDELRSCAVVLDRWWWSSIAYGWYGGDVPPSGLSQQTFEGLVAGVWAPLRASVVFMFSEPFEADTNNSHGATVGYKLLARDLRELTVHVPRGDPASMTAYILDELDRRALLDNGN